MIPNIQPYGKNRSGNDRPERKKRLKKPRNIQK
jgi:hypothetical protein